MKNKITWAFLISLLALFLRVFMALHGPYEYDETVYFNEAVHYNLAMRSGDWDQILNSTTNTEHPQFYKLVYAAGLLPFQPMNEIGSLRASDPLKENPRWPTVASIRMISGVFGTAAVFVLSMIHPLAGLFLAVDTLEVKYTSVIYLEALPQLLCLLSMLGALKALKIYQGAAVQSTRRSWLKWLVLSALAMGMALASKYMYGAIIIAIGAAVLWRGWKQRGFVLLGLVGWGILCAAFFVLFDPILWNGLLARLSSSIQFSFNYQTSSYISYIGYPFWQPIFWLMRSIPQYRTVVNPPFFMNQGDFFVLADPLIFILALVGLPPLFMKNKPMFCWLVVGLAFLLAWGTKWPQYTLLVLPAFCLSAGYGLEFLRDYLPGGKASIVERLGKNQPQ